MKDAPVNDPGFVGVAYDLVTFSPEYSQIVANLLGKTIVVESLADAIRISRNNDDRYRIVTLDGQMVHAGGSMTGGSAAKGTGILSRANELRTLKERRKELDGQMEACREQLEKARSALAAVRNDLDIAMEERNALAAKDSSLRAEFSAVSSTTKQFKILLESLSGDSDVRKKAIEDAKHKIAVLRQQAEEKEKELSRFAEATAAIRREIDKISRSKLELEGRRSRTEKSTQERNNEIIELERKKARIEQKKLSADLEEKQSVHT